MSRARTAARLLRSPSQLWLLFRMAGWASVLPLLKVALPLPRLVSMVAARPRTRQRDPEAEKRVVRSAARLYRSRLVAKSDNCLERSLVTYRYLARVNAGPRLVVGMGRRGDVVGHVWVLVDGKPVHDDEESLRDLVPVVGFGPDGDRVEG